jgi:hypothetical protein
MPLNFELGVNTPYIFTAPQNKAPAQDIKKLIYTANMHVYALINRVHITRSTYLNKAV